jgi:hypothetical protein
LIRTHERDRAAPRRRKWWLFWAPSH